MHNLQITFSLPCFDMKSGWSNLGEPLNKYINLPLIVNDDAGKPQQGKDTLFWRHENVMWRHHLFITILIRDNKSRFYRRALFKQQDFNPDFALTF